MIGWLSDTLCYWLEGVVTIADICVSVLEFYWLEPGDWTGG